ncbi:hypothetical protein N7510_007538 [Penicillium lagena]|uniref:uncharacterized protein n=1 Tax=Penicillium lagena TaxID=94218 RepID=UPI00253FBFF9|nr:uncharacterized protein N7510_007538 [Penicillium lagena]KAJ5610819.1 hypothetical protein N7510_007538 [Penicillium lagena]
MAAGLAYSPVHKRFLPEGVPNEMNASSTGSNDLTPAGDVDGPYETLERPLAAMRTNRDDHPLQQGRRCRDKPVTISLFSLLLIPLFLGILLLMSHTCSWHLSDSLYNVVDEYRSTVQIVVQIISAGLAAIEALALCRLINLATRIRFTRAPVTLDVLGFWSALSTATTPWYLPTWMIVVTILVCNLSAVFSALWTGALTPVSTVGLRGSTIYLPDWSNLSLIKEYPSQIDETGLSVRNAKGYFTYSVGLGLLNSLLASASSASTVDGGTRNHNKLDYTRYSYHGRSYGAGASPGLSDLAVPAISHAPNYTYREDNLEASVSCIHNGSSLFHLGKTDEQNLYAATGYLPDSTVAEYSVYVGWSEHPIVSIGVAHHPSPFTDKLYMAIAAGSDYAALNKAQCTVNFTPASFNISVDIQKRNITVRKEATSASANSIRNIDPDHTVAYVVMRQLELIANDLTSFYRSVLGDAFNASISDFRTAVANQITTSNTLPESQIVMRGLENAVVSLVDDMLVGYASAQMMVGRFTAPVSAEVGVSALQVGSQVYIIASVTLAAVIALLIGIEAVRMRGWGALPAFDYLDQRMLILGVSRGGQGIAKYAQDRECKDYGSVPVMWNAGGSWRAWRGHYPRFRDKGRKVVSFWCFMTRIDVHNNSVTGRSSEWSGWTGACADKAIFDFLSTNANCYGEELQVHWIPCTLCLIIMAGPD